MADNNSILNWLGLMGHYLPHRPCFINSRTHLHTHTVTYPHIQMLARVYNAAHPNYNMTDDVKSGRVAEAAMKI